MKKFNDIVAGDIIYYYDHGKIKAQKVHSVRRETVSGTDYWGRHWKREELLIQAGRSKEIDFNYVSEYSDCSVWGIHKFACLEAAEKFIERLKANANKKIQYANETIVKYQKLLSKYDISFD